MFTLPTTAVADITSKVSSLFSDFWVIVALMIGVPLGFWIIRKIIEIVSGEPIVDDPLDEEQTDHWYAWRHGGRDSDEYERKKREGYYK